MKEFFKERVNYTRDGEYYVGYLANLPQVLCQAKSKQELEEKLIKTGKSFLEMLQGSLDRGELELREFPIEEWIGLKR